MRKARAVARRTGRHSCPRGEPVSGVIRSVWYPVDGLPRLSSSLLRRRELELRALFRLLVLRVVGDVFLEFTQSF